MRNTGTTEQLRTGSARLLRTGEVEKLVDGGADVGAGRAVVDRHLEDPLLGRAVGQP